MVIFKRRPRFFYVIGIDRLINDLKKKGSYFILIF